MTKIVKGASIKFTDYSVSVSKLLDILNISKELKKHDKIVLKPFLSIHEPEASTPIKFVEAVLSFILKNKNPVAEVFIAEGTESIDTSKVFESYGYKELAENYSIGLIDLNNSQTEIIKDHKFTKLSEISYPSILLESFVISLPKLCIVSEDSDNRDLLIHDSTTNMLGCYPLNIYHGFLSRKKTKIRKYNLKYSVNDIIACKRPNFSIIDASDKGIIIAGLPFEVDIQAVKLLGLEPRNLPHLRLLEDNIFSEDLSLTQKA